GWRAVPLESASMRWPPCTLTLGPKAERMPWPRSKLALFGGLLPLGSTHLADFMPHFLGSLRTVQISTALAPLTALGSATARPLSQGCGTLPALPSQSSSPSTMPPSPVWMVSTAPGLTLGSQSLQSPCIGVQPSPSMSALGSVTVQGTPVLVLVDP